MSRQVLAATNESEQVLRLEKMQNAHLTLNTVKSFCELRGRDSSSDAVEPSMARSASFCGRISLYNLLLTVLRLLTGFIVDDMVVIEISLATSSREVRLVVSFDYGDTVMSVE